MSSRLALDPQGRSVAITTTRSLGLEIGDVFVIVDGRPVEPTSISLPLATNIRPASILTTFDDDQSGVTGSGCVASLLFLDFGQQLVYYLRRLDPYQPAKEAPALP